MIRDKFDMEHDTVKDGNEKTSKVGFGWAALQIDILRECIVVSEAIQGKKTFYFLSFIYFVFCRSCFYALLYHCVIEKLVSIYIKR